MQANRIRLAVQVTVLVLIALVIAIIIALAVWPGRAKAPGSMGGQPFTTAVAMVER